MIVKDIVQIGNKTFVHTYSDKGFKLEREGDIYDDAFDLAEFGRTYTETDEPIEPVEVIEE